MAARSPTLHVDILLDIMDVSSTSTVAVLMRTCRALYYAGPRYVLKDGPFVRDSPGDTDAFLRSFCLFLLAERGIRFRYLRQIYFGVWWIQNKDVADMLYECVKKMTHLEVLVFVIDLDAMLDVHPGLGDAFAELRTVKHLEVSSTGKKCYSMLRSMRSQLVDVQLKLWQEDEDDELPATPDLNPVTLLAHSRESLQRLQCEAWDCHRFPAGSPIYPAMRNLTLDCEELPTTAALVQAYPELSHLTLRWADYDLPSDTAALVNLLEAKRTGNLRAQRGIRGWQKLNEVSGSMGALFALGLCCHVENLLPNEVKSDADLVMLAVLLEHTRPAYLRLNTLGAFFDERPFDLPATLHKDGASALRTLDIAIEHSEDVSHDAPVEDYLAFLLHTVRGLRLEKLSVTFDGSPFVKPDEDDPNYIVANGEAGRYLHNLNLPALVGGFLTVLPDMKSIKMELKGLWNPDGNSVEITRADTNGERSVVIEHGIGHY
ncbi:uncharacterized protein TRAVEDRAFT_52945 [Trametes versicolor FP-101664 SS1]|uniref:uncharacterized protein n=1 Tax=Trametes versicolor (strain FP-101664) TaxID=717944 RepID=UPI000462200C|nr:uncharacterized protein TRAVEDRAFT_52945 [Trametes versicolor FP-101664 SS1]EIW52501.1 hypothetical protein TRAVEDRAFT_52945 [Trametes versicolor FP-101664 SS1]